MNNVKKVSKDKPKQETDLAWEWILKFIFQAIYGILLGTKC